MHPGAFAILLSACPPAFDQADAVLAAHVADRALPGAAVAVFDGAGTNLHERFLGAYGPGTFVPIASATKAVSAAVLLSLVDDGTMSLDDTVATYLPQYAGTPNGAITVRQAFSQTSGLWNDEWPCVGDGQTTLDACARDILDHAPRVSEPGATFFYGGNSMHVAGRLAEIAYCNRFPASCAGLGSGQIWIRIFNERIKNPLGIGMFFNSATNPRIAGGLVSRLSDYRKFWRMVLTGGTVDGVRVLSPEAIDAMTRDQTGGAPVYYSAAQPDVRYGLGVWRFEGVLSDPGKFGFHPWFDLATGLGGIVLLNDPDGAAQGGGRHVAFQIESIVRDRALAGDGDADADGVCDAADLCPDTFEASPSDLDGDGAGDACDCAMTDPRAWSAPGETGRAIFYGPPTCLDVFFNPVNGAITCFGTRNLFDWFQPDRPGGVVTDLRYDVIRSDVPWTFTAATTCEATAIDRDGPFNHRYLTAAPASGSGFHYLVRASNSCGAGPAGRSSAGEAIAARPCP